MKTIITHLLLYAFCLSATAQKINALVAVPNGATNQTLVQNNLAPQLNNALNAVGMGASTYANWMLICNVVELRKDISTTIPVQISAQWQIQLSVLDLALNKTFGGTSLNLSGIGETEQQAMQSALRGLNQAEIKKHLSKVNAEVLSYYNVNCSSLLEQARSYAAAESYGSALSITNAMLQTNSCGNQALALNSTYYAKYVAQNCSNLVGKARAAWSASPNKWGAQEAKFYLQQLTPNSSCVKSAKALADEISSTLKLENTRMWNFLEVKANAEAEQTKLELEAAKAVAMAWAKDNNTDVTIIK